MAKTAKEDPWAKRPGGLIEGEELVLGTRVVTVPGLNWGRQRVTAAKLKRMSELEAKMQGKWPPEPPPPEYLDLFADVVLLALSRNYPHLTKEALEEDLDLRNSAKIWLAIMGLSGIKQGAPGEGPGDPLTGTPSIAK